MSENDDEFPDDLELTAEPAKILAKKQISDYVYVSIDEDFDVTILDTFMGETKSILPKEEAIGVAQFIIEFFEKDSN